MEYKNKLSKGKKWIIHNVEHMEMKKKSFYFNVCLNRVISSNFSGESLTDQNTLCKFPNT